MRIITLTEDTGLLHLIHIIIIALIISPVPEAVFGKM